MGSCVGSNLNSVPPELKTNTKSQITASNSRFKAEQVSVIIDEQIKKLKDKSKKIDNLVLNKKEQAKKLIESGLEQSKREARRIISTVSHLHKQASNIEVRIKVLEEKKVQVQHYQLNAQTIDILDNANKVMEEDYRNKLQDVRQQAINQRLIQKNINGQFQEMIDEDLEDDADKMFEEMQTSVRKEQKKRLDQNNLNVKVSVTKTKGKDDIDAMLNEL